MARLVQRSVRMAARANSPTPCGRSTQVLGGSVRRKRLLSRCVRMRIGDIGWVIERQSRLYAEEYGWNGEYEALVAEIGAAFIRNFRPGKEFCWIAEQGGDRLGAVFLVRKSDEDGQLRLLHVEREARGFGVGSQAGRRMRRRRQARSATAGWCYGPTMCWSMPGASTSAPASSWPARSITTVLARIWSARTGNWCCRVAGSSSRGRALAHINA